MVNLQITSCQNLPSGIALIFPVIPKIDIETYQIVPNGFIACVWNIRFSRYESVCPVYRPNRFFISASIRFLRAGFVLLPVCSCFNR